MKYFTKEYYSNLYSTNKTWFFLVLGFVILGAIYWLSTLVAGFKNLAYIVVVISLILFSIYAWKTSILQRGRIRVKKWWRSKRFSTTTKIFVGFFVIFLFWWQRPLYHDMVVNFLLIITNFVVIVNVAIVVISIIYIIYKALHRKKNSKDIEFIKLIKIPVILTILSSAVTYYTIQTGSVDAIALNKAFKTQIPVILKSEPIPAKGTVTLMSEQIARFAASSNRLENSSVTDFDKVYVNGQIVFTGAFIPKKTNKYLTYNRVFGKTLGFASVKDNLILKKALTKYKGKHLTYEATDMQLSKNLESSVVRSFTFNEFILSKTRNELRVLVDGKMYLIVQVDKMDWKDFPNMYLKPYKTIVINEITKDETKLDSIKRSLFGTSGKSIYPIDYNTSTILASQVLVSKQFQKYIAKSAEFTGGLVDRFGKHEKELQIDSLYKKPLINIQWYNKMGDEKFTSSKPFAIMHMVSRQIDAGIKSAVNEIWYMSLDGSNKLYKLDVRNNNITAPSTYASPVLTGDNGKSYNKSDYKITKLVALPNSKGTRFIIATISAIDDEGNINSNRTIPIAINTDTGVRKTLKLDIPVEEQINNF